MPEIRCEFCHEFIDPEEYGYHRAQHLKLRPDGQHNDYVTLPPEGRKRGGLANVPRVYVHEHCGTATGMPEEIIRSYLADPYLYLADETFCRGCRDHVPMQECTWTETGEDLQSYMDRLRLEKLARRPRLLARLRVALSKLFLG